MSMQVERAIELYQQASDAEKQGNVERAEALYLECVDIFKQAGDMHIADAANVLNTPGFMRQELGDHAFALTAAEEAARMRGTMDETESSRDVREIRLQAWG